MANLVLVYCSLMPVLICVSIWFLYSRIFVLYYSVLKFGGEVVHVGILALQAKGISCFGWEVRQKLRVLEYL